MGSGSKLKLIEQQLAGKSQPNNATSSLEAGSSKLQEVLMMQSCAPFELEDDLMDVVPPPVAYEKSFLRKIPSIVMEAHESTVSIPNNKDEINMSSPDANLLLVGSCYGKERE